MARPFTGTGAGCVADLTRAGGRNHLARCRVDGLRRHARTDRIQRSLNRGFSDSMNCIIFLWDRARGAAMRVMSDT